MDGVESGIYLGWYDVRVRRSDRIGEDRIRQRTNVSIGNTGLYVDTESYSKCDCCLHSISAVETR